MPVNVGTLLTNLAKKAGYDPTLLAFPSESFELPDDFVAVLDSKLLTEDSAKNNPALKNHFRANALDAVDKNILSILDEFEFDEDSRNEIVTAKSTYDKIPALAKKIRDLEAAKGVAGKSDKTALQEQINQLNKQISQLSTEKEKAILEERAKAHQEITEHIFKHSIESVDLVTDMFDKPAMLQLAEQRIRAEMAAQGARVILKDGTLTLVQASDEALDFYKDNKRVTYNDFRDNVLANAKIVRVPKPAGQTGTPAVNGNPSTSTTATTAPVNNSILARIEAAKAAYLQSGS